LGDNEYINQLEKTHKQVLEHSRQWVKYQMQQLDSDPEYQLQGVFSEAFRQFKEMRK